MSLMGTLAKVAIGYAAARGVDSLSRSRGGMPGQFGGAQVPADEARAEQAPGMGSLQDMIGQMASGAGMGDLQNMIANMANRLTSMPPQAAVSIAAGWSNSDLVAVFRQMEEEARIAGRASIVPYLLTLMPAERAATITTLMMDADAEQLPR